LARIILLADDSVTAQNMGRRILMDAGYEVITVNNGAAALKRVAERKPDIIVLDVYMPGYGGLEVCQRLKENRETSRIPVLLTVGKLEPFKVEEARRVRADMHIVKPFEASELLTALTKLEDKIVPRADAFKPGRFAKAIAQIEESAGADRFEGDEETGWKNRLSIPRPEHKAQESEPEPEVMPGKKSLKELIEAQESAARAAEPIPDAPSRLPQDITPEEIAAISSVAASLANESVLKPQDGVAEPVQDSPTAAMNTASSLKEEAEETPAEQEPELSSAGAETQPAALADQPAAELTIEAAAPENPEQKSTTEEALIPKFNEEEVSSVLAQLAPSNGNAHHLVNEASEDTVPATAAATSTEAVRASTEPRWVAEAVAVAEDEAQLVLEVEMQKAFAAFAAAEAEPVSFAMAPADDPENIHVASGTVGFGGASLDSADSQSGSGESSDKSCEKEAEPYGVEAIGESTSDGRVEPQPAPAETPSPVEVESARATSETTTSPESGDQTIPPQAEAVEVTRSSSEPELAVEQAKEAMAAAAAAGGSPIEAVSRIESGSPAGYAAETAQAEAQPAAIMAPTETYRESDLAAAWQNWKQIRDSAVGQSAPEAGGSSDMVFKDIRRETPVAKEPEVEVEEVAASEESEDTDIASIVDSVLAEMKPKIVQEIAKKMAKNKRH
jgi:CheY-like chemotaxis protein